MIQKNISSHAALNNSLKVVKSCISRADKTTGVLASQKREKPNVVPVELSSTFTVSENNA